jgi:hypothetical protein
MYKLSFDKLAGCVTTVIRLSDGAAIPMLEANTDYAEYLKWLAEGNEPLPPDEPNGE